MTATAQTCPQCGAPMTLDEARDYFYCSYCGSYVVPDPDKEGVALLEQTTDLKCPLCGTLLAEAQANTIHILACPNCHGNLIPQSHMLPIIDAASPVDSDLARLERPPDLAELQRKLTCPSCHNGMESYEYGGCGSVIIQGCQACGLIWLDFGELSKIIYASQHTQEPIPDEREERQDNFNAGMMNI